MAPFLIVLLALQLLQATTWAKVAGTSHYDLNSIHDKYSDFSLNPASELSTETDDFSDGNGKADLHTATVEVAAADIDDNIPIIQTIDDKTELQFRQPIEWVNVDQLRNVIVLKFFSPNTNYLNMLDPEELRRLRRLQENSMRLGKRAFDPTTSYPASNSRNDDFLEQNKGTRVDNSHQVVRDSRGDNFMRFGRSVNGDGERSNDFMRFGRAGENSDFMRFGRAAGQDFMRFGRSPGQDFMRFGRSPGQDFMRFGRAPAQDFMRFGRAPAQDFMRFGRAPAQDFMRFGRVPAQDFMRFGRAPAQDFMRFGRAPAQDFMRFGRAPAQDFMRFGRTPSQDFMRFGRSPGQDFMRFGRAPAQDFMRFGRAPPSQDVTRSYKDSEVNNFARYSRPDNFMRFGRTPPQSSDFMRFGKSLEKSENHTSASASAQSQLDKNELKQAVKLIHEADRSADNPVDKAIKVLFDNHREQDQMHNDPDSTQHEDSGDQNMDMNYFLKTLKK